MFNQQKPRISPTVTGKKKTSEKDDKNEESEGVEMNDESFVRENPLIEENMDEVPDDDFDEDDALGLFLLN